MLQKKQSYFTNNGMQQFSTDFRLFNNNFNASLKIPETERNKGEITQG